MLVLHISTCDQFRANLTRANLYNADLAGADLSMAKLSGDHLTGAMYDNRTLWPANFTHPPEAKKVTQ